MMTKTAKIKKHFQNGNSLTSWEAIEKFNCTRLAAVVCNLKKQGMRFETTKKSHTNSEGQTSRYAEYKCTNAEGNKNQLSMFSEDAKEFRAWLDA
tara:strand:+ start:47 stop:331 length:285 start_codon:yes stop_codon:yes gene_type:complete